MITLLEEKGIIWKNIILCQDATMQHRMEAGLRKYAPDKIIINYASYQAKVCCQDEKLQDEELQYENKNFIAHVDIPEDVRKAFELLKTVYGEETNQKAK